ncbi:helix-turn-helix domain-containing protein [Sphingomonas sp. AX6]|uniref:helix-turn-helix domain-containing protein n=1 Tax=Sphingomonas sp. AX6 TaxID=2653171 RepID=UPI001356C47B|nr:helix-turn-helix domain-containing protein [Sphingomonas sp. AX6]
MSIRIMTAVWGMDLPDSEKIVLLALADCANDEGICWPSVASLAKKCSKSDRTIQAAIKSLTAAGHLTRDERPGKGVLYTLHPTPAATAPRKDCAPKRATPTPEAASDKPSRTPISSSDASHPSKGTGAQKRGWPKDMPPPANVPDDCWAGFIEHRKAKRQTLTPRAYVLLCKKLAELAEDGWPPGEMIDRAVEHGWTSVFPPKSNETRHAQPGRPARGRFRDPLLNEPDRGYSGVG